MTQQDMLKEFIRSFSASLDPRLWIKLIKEELKEFEEAELEDDREHLLKEAIDLVYVVYGLEAVMPGGPGSLNGLIRDEELDEYRELFGRVSDALERSIMLFPDDEAVVKAFERAHKSNMSKLDDFGQPIYREDGKILKGPNYKAPDLSDLV